MLETFHYFVYPSLPQYLYNNSPYKSLIDMYHIAVRASHESSLGYGQQHRREFTSYAYCIQSTTHQHSRIRIEPRENHTGGAGTYPPAISAMPLSSLLSGGHNCVKRSSSDMLRSVQATAWSPYGCAGPAAPMPPISDTDSHVKRLRASPGTSGSCAQLPFQLAFVVWILIGNTCAHPSRNAMLLDFGEVIAQEVFDTRETLEV